MKRILVMILVLSFLMSVGCGGTSDNEVTDKSGSGESMKDDETSVTDTVSAESEQSEDVSVPTEIAAGFADTTYSVSGAEKLESGAINAQGTFTVSFDAPFGLGFNYYKISYSSDAMLKATVSYTSGSSVITDTVFLEAGENAVFSAFTVNALNKKTCEGISSVELTALDRETVTFSLSDITCEKRDIPTGSDTVYINSEKYKLGIKLTYGGGISYFEDLADGDVELTNLLNNHDAGRLVQQSYYGTSSAPYECGTYNGTVWGYNPVQGGDLYNNRSRLVDYTVSDDGTSIYVKCQPLDWAKRKSYTPSYMENVYTVKDGYVQVDNRFIDFSGYNHKKRHQELPAFYTVSYLSEFVCYLGSAAWTDDELTLKKELAFWGGNDDAYFDLQSEETWCAWCAENGYGVGVYTPIAEILLAGRHNYDGSKTDSADSTSYVAPLITYKLKSYEAFEYSYYITAGTVEDMRASFKAIAESIPQSPTED